MLRQQTLFNNSHSSNNGIMEKGKECVVFEENKEEADEDSTTIWPPPVTPNSDRSWETSPLGRCFLCCFPIHHAQPELHPHPHQYDNNPHHRKLLSRVLEETESKLRLEADSSNGSSTNTSTNTTGSSGSSGNSSSYNSLSLSSRSLTTSEKSSFSSQQQQQQPVLCSLPDDLLLKEETEETVADDDNEDKVPLIQLDKGSIPQQQQQPTTNADPHPNTLWLLAWQMVISLMYLNWFHNQRQLSRHRRRLRDDSSTDPDLPSNSSQPSLTPHPTSTLSSSSSPSSSSSSSGPT